MANNSKTKTDMTNLAVTYMYGQPSGKSSINFYEHSRNAENTIDDPIFTGFTMVIDNEHSPLFFTGTGDSYSSAETLRGKGSTDLANTIETRLEQMNKYHIQDNTDSYEINTMSVKGEISDGIMAGYGLQDKYYLENVLYGATDYIYMVDKTTISAYGDTLGVSDLGSGTPNNTSVYAQTNKTVESELHISDDIYGEYDDPELVQDSLSENIDLLSAQNSNGSKNKEEHTQNEKDRESAKTAYEEEKNGKNGSESLESMKERLKKLEDAYDSDLKTIQETLKSYQDEMETQSKILQNNPANSTAANKIEEIKEKFEDLRENAEEKFKNIKVTFSNPDVTDAVKNVTSSIKEQITDAYKCINTKIETYKANNELNTKITDLKDKIAKKETVLYGGPGLSEGSATDDSLYGKYRIAKNKANNDSYSAVAEQIKSLENAKANYEDTVEYNSIQSQKTTTTSNLPSTDPSDYETENDYEKAMSAARSSRETYEASQTVYDMLGFISGMKSLTEEYPYIMQTVTGLDEAYKKYFSLKDPYQGSGDEKITITCFESLDLRVSSMFNKYLNAAYDRQYKRERLPVNLRRFTCSIFVHDIRNFRHALAGLGSNFTEKKLGDDAKSLIAEVALNYVSAVEFKFFDCEIVPEETGSIFDSVANDNAGDMKKTNFTFTYGNCVINFLPFADLKKYYKPTNGDTKETSKDQFKSSDFSGMRTNVSQDAVNTYNNVVNNTSSGDFRMWFDKSELGNVNNNDYRDYVRKDSSVAVNDYYKSTMVNNFALNSVVNKNKQLTKMDDALRRIVVGVSASTGLSTSKVTDALNLGFVDQILNDEDKSNAAITKDLGTIDNIETGYKGTVVGFEETVNGKKRIKNYDIVKDLGNVNEGNHIHY